MTGWPVGRMYCEGIQDDRGDLRGVPGHCIQVAALKKPQVAARHKVTAVEAQRLNYQAIDPSIHHGVALIRLHRIRVTDPWDRWRAVWSFSQMRRYDSARPLNNILSIAAAPADASRLIADPSQDNAQIIVASQMVAVITLPLTKTSQDRADSLRFVTSIPAWVEIVKACQK